MIPDYMLKEDAGAGFRYSIAVVILAALGAVVFCLSLAI